MGRIRTNAGIAVTGKPGVSNKGRTLHLRENTNQPPELDVAGYSCSMTSTNRGGGLTYDFDPDPVKVTWSANATINLIPTRGGQAAYSSARIIGPLTILGYLRSRWDLLDLGQFVYAHMEEAHLKGKPLRFTYPERDFDFSLYIQNINEIGLDAEQGEIVGYSLTCVVTKDHTALTQAELSQLLPGIPENIEWINVESAAKIAEERFGYAVPSGNPAGTSVPGTLRRDGGGNPHQGPSPSYAGNIEEISAEEQSVARGILPPSNRFGI